MTQVAHVTLATTLRWSNKSRRRPSSFAGELHELRRLERHVIDQPVARYTAASGRTTDRTRVSLYAEPESNPSQLPGAGRLARPRGTHYCPLDDARATTRDLSPRVFYWFPCWLLALTAIWFRAIMPDNTIAMKTYLCAIYLLLLIGPRV